MKKVQRRDRTALGSTKLADFYRRRAEQYRDLIQALSDPEHLEPSDQRSDWTGDLVHLEPEVLSACASAPRPQCDADTLEPRIAIYVGDNVPRRFVGSEALFVLASLSDGTAEAIHNGDLLLAAELTDLHSTYLAAHAECCLSELVRSLASSGSANGGRLALWLQNSIREDLERRVGISAGIAPTSAPAVKVK